MVRGDEGAPTDRLSEIQQRLQRATPGPWEWFGPAWLGNDQNGDVLEFPAAPPSPDDAELIAHAPADLAFLLGRVERLEAQVARVEREATALELLARDEGLPGRTIALRLGARSIRSALKS